MVTFGNVPIAELRANAFARKTFDLPAEVLEPTEAMVLAGLLRGSYTRGTASVLHRSM